MRVAKAVTKKKSIKIFPDKKLLTRFEIIPRIKIRIMPQTQKGNHKRLTATRKIPVKKIIFKSSFSFKDKIRKAIRVKFGTMLSISKK
jgi:hypothetical protein